MRDRQTLFHSYVRSFSIPFAFFCLLVIACSVTSCKKNKQINISDFWSCHESRPNDSAAIAHQLQNGPWVLQHRSCYWTSKTTVFENKTEILFGTGMFSLFKNGVEVKTGAWKLKPSLSNAGKWEVEQDDAIQELYGSILLCDDQVMFYDSFRDGCDHLFTRKK